VHYGTITISFGHHNLKEIKLGGNIMITRTVFISLTVTTFTVLSGCMHATSSEIKSGSNVNNGPGPVGDILICDSLSDDSIKFTIRHTAAFTLKQGLFQHGENFVTMQCDQVEGSQQSGADHPSPLWKCTELRQGGGLYRVNVYRQGLSALKLADITIDQIFPLPPKKIASLVCKDPIE